MKVAVVGYGIEGQSAASYWQQLGNQITVCDQNTDLVLLPEYQGQLGPKYLENLDQFDLIVRQQSIHPTKLNTTKPVTSVINEFMANCPAKVIGVTGTKGKGTTSSLIVKILEAAKHKVWLGGNIGTSPLDFLDKVSPNDYVVLELSSSQLIDVDHSPQVALCLAITPDHLNYHSDLAEYAEAKANIFRHQKPSDLAVYYQANAEATRIAQLSPGTKRPYPDENSAYIKEDAVWYGGQQIIKTSEVGLLGPHNLDNICGAAAAIWDIVKRPKPLHQAIKAFTGLEHRLELAGTVRGVRFYDDSFATTPETAMAALKSFSQPKVLILGGSTKEVSFNELADAVGKSNVRQVILIGNSSNPNHKINAEDIENALKQKGFTAITSLVRAGGPSMQEIVRASLQAAQTGDVVLLSTASASFDMFKNYKDRGDQFKLAVTKLV